MIRDGNEAYLQAPPPSPIPSAIASRSSAAHSIFSDQHNHHHPADLIPPMSSSTDTTTTNNNNNNTVVTATSPPAKACLHDPEDISLPSIRSRDASAVDRLLRSAREFGTFRVTDHGISSEELRSLVQGAERVFQVLEDTDMGHPPRNFARLRESREQIEWVRSGEERMEWARGWVGRDGSRRFGEVMEKIAMKLDAIGKMICEVFSENWTKRQFGRRFEEKDSVVRLYRYNRSSTGENIVEAVVNPEMEDGSGCHAVCLHLPASPSHFLLNSSPSLLSFEAGPQAIVVSVGRRLQEWSLGDFKCISGEVMCSPKPEEQPPCFSVELKCLSLNFDVNHHLQNQQQQQQQRLQNQKRRQFGGVSVKTQILIGLSLALFYKVFVYLWELHKIRHT